MTKTFNFKTKTNYTFPINNNDDSKTLDNLIAASIIKKNSYLFDNDTYNGDLFTSLIDNNPIIITGSKLKADDDFIKAANFLANYKSYKKIYNLPYILGKMYKLSDGTPIIFYDDEIQIGFDTYSYNDFGNIKFLNNLTSTTKDIIINIYTSNAGKIKINIL